ncbi:MAG TPA: YetF domain-containing protein [Chloroflexota bacterium]|nr:YetF domain-containing protein [Chloroflexota bacterium]
MDPQDLLLTAGRASLVYVFVLLVIRLLGKRSVGAFGAFDLLVALMLGEVVDEIIFGDVSLAKGFVAISIIGVWHFVNGWAAYKSTFIDWLTESKACALVEHGEIRHDHLASERMNEEELWTALREEGIEDIKEVKRAMLEPDGRISVIQEEWAKPLEKGDLKAARGPQAVAA